MKMYIEYNTELSPKREPVYFDYKEVATITRERKRDKYIARRNAMKTKKWAQL